ncbi:MAG: spore cortex-lytic enzyme [Clostridia bacterium]|nr:spore cortex-lytic enzyme [Clostridia bacterium]
METKKQKISFSKFKKLFALCLVLMFACVLGGTLYAVNYNATEQVTVVATVSENKQVQQKLKDLGYYNGAVDGIFGAKTVQAVKNFQRDYGLTVDGIVGKNTLAKLGLGSASGKYSSNDIYLLAKCVHAEARGEPYVGQVAVAAVILNRVKNPNFPNTISGVVYQPWAFTAVHDGQINLEPNSTAYSAAQDAMNGWDPTYGCIYYYNPQTATSQWIFSRQTVVTIGQHVFAI